MIAFKTLVFDASLFEEMPNRRNSSLTPELHEFFNSILSKSKTNISEKLYFGEQSRNHRKNVSILIAAAECIISSKRSEAPLHHI